MASVVVYFIFSVASATEVSRRLDTQSLSMPPIDKRNDIVSWVCTLR